jgi:hypothetical protein
MVLDDTFWFGKHEGYSIRQVYQGVNEVHPYLLKNYIRSRISSIIPANDERETLGLFEFEVEDGLLTATIGSEDLDRKDFSGLFENLFREPDKLRERPEGFLPIEEIALELQDGDQNHQPIISGRPDYIEWCILNLKVFCLDPEDIDFLQRIPYHIFKGLNLKKVANGLYAFGPEIENHYYTFSDRAMEENARKFEVDHSQSSFPEDSHGDIGDFGVVSSVSCPACGEYPCMCSDPGD